MSYLMLRCVRPKGNCEFGRLTALPSRPVNALYSSSAPGQDIEADWQAAREWYKNLQSTPMPNDIGEISYARSSGPGGQNVNKVNSKAQLRVSLDQLLPLLPRALHEGIRSSRYCAEKTSSILIQADESRKQAANKDACYRKLNDIVVSVYKDVIPGETSEAQKKRVDKLINSENESRLRLKKHHSSKKAARRGGND